MNLRRSKVPMLTEPSPEELRRYYKKMREYGRGDKVFFEEWEIPLSEFNESYNNFNMTLPKYFDSVQKHVEHWGCRIANEPQNRGNIKALANFIADEKTPKRILLKHKFNNTFNRCGFRFDDIIREGRAK